MNDIIAKIKIFELLKSKGVQPMAGYDSYEEYSLSRMSPEEKEQFEKDKKEMAQKSEHENWKASLTPESLADFIKTFDEKGAGDNSPIDNEIG